MRLSNFFAMQSSRQSLFVLGRNRNLQTSNVTSCHLVQGITLPVEMVEVEEMRALHNAKQCPDNELVDALFAALREH